jgi:pyridoxine kinase
MLLAPERLARCCVTQAVSAMYETLGQFERRDFRLSERRLDEVALACTQVVTSLHTNDADSITVLGSTVAPQRGSPSRFHIRLPRLQGAFTGTGDLMAALLLAHTDQEPDRIGNAVEQAVASLQAVLQVTLAAAGDASEPEDKSAAGARSRELRLIQGQDAITNPDVKHRAKPL